ncbi:Molybdate transporter 2 [Nymphaea thermarum]|nr:Molybdate transporter 2 [Nymphaea thermarum]
MEAEEQRTPLLPQQHRCLSHCTGSFRLKTSLSSELSGAVGDLGTFIPIVLALTLVNHLDLGTTLIFTGLYNIATGYLFGVPMPVQPMKSIAAVAIAEGPNPLTVAQIAAAGISTAAVLLLLGVTGLMAVFYRLIPLPVVRGIQLAQGLSFAFSAVKYIRFSQNVSTGKSESPRPFLGLDGLLLALFSLCFIILVTGSGSGSGCCNEPSTSSNRTTNSESGHEDRKTRPRIPAALIIFFVGIALCFIRNPAIVKNLKFGPSRISLLAISMEDWKVGFLRAAIPQIPLSILNSVIAVCKLSTDLFPESGARVSATTVSVSVGAMNLIGCWFGAMPVCHGAGGLAGQYRFGARSGFAVLALGLVKLVLGLVLGNSFKEIIGEFPTGVLGVLLLFSGIELAMASRDMNTKEESFVMLVCAAVSLTGSSAALGFGCGLVLFGLLRAREVDWVGPVRRRGWFGESLGEDSAQAE